MVSVRQSWELTEGIGRTLEEGLIITYADECGRVVEIERYLKYQVEEEL